MCDDRGPRRAAELTGDGQVAAGGTEQVLQGTDVRTSIADALDRVVGRQGRDCPATASTARALQRRQQAAAGRRASACIRRARVRQHRPEPTRPIVPPPGDCPMDRRDGAEEHLDGPLDDQPTRRQPARPAPAQPVVRWRRAEPLGCQPTARRDRRAVDADRCRHRWRRHPRCAPGRFRVAGTARGHGRRQPGRGAQRGAPCPPEAGSRPAPAAGPRRPERLPYQNETFDVGHASLVVHHLDEDEAVRSSRSSAVVSRRESSSTICTVAASDCSGRGSPAGSSGTTTRATICCCPSGGPTRCRGRSCCAGPGSSRSIGIGVRAAPRGRRGPAAARPRSRRPVTGPDVAIVGGGPAGRSSRRCWPAPATTSRCSSEARHTAGEPAACSRRPPRSPRSAASASARPRLPGLPGPSRPCASRHPPGSPSDCRTATASRSGSTARARSGTPRRGGRPARRCAPAPGSRR